MKLAPHIRTVLFGTQAIQYAEHTRHQETCSPGGAHYDWWLVFYRVEQLRPLLTCRSTTGVRQYSHQQAGRRSSGTDCSLAFDIAAVRASAFLVDRLQDVPEDPIGHLPALRAAHFVRAAEMDSLVDPHIDRIQGQIREAVIRAGFRRGIWIRADDREVHPIRPEVQFQYTRQRASHIIGARGPVRIVWGIEQRLPIRVALRLWVAVILALPDGGDRSPEGILLLAIPRSNERIGDRQRAQRQQPRIVADVIGLPRGNIPKRLVVEEEQITTKETGELGLLWRAHTVGERAQSLHLVIVLGVLLTAQGWWGIGAKLISAVQREGWNRAEPRTRHRSE
jgi:hypothetical protein